MNAQPQQSFLLGLFGRGIGGSHSPRLHEKEARAQGVSLVYRLFDFTKLAPGLADLGKLLGIIQCLGFDGINVTHPYKTDIVPLLDELSTEATALGAVNTVVLRGGRRIGHNTDWSGFAASLRYGLPDAELHNVIQLGAGGAGAATAYALLTMGTQRLQIHDIDSSRAAALTDKLSRLFPERTVTSVSDLSAAMRDTNGLVQSTPVGMTGHAGIALSPQLLNPDMWVADIIYTPAETELLGHARRLGCRTVNGIGMVAFQGAEAFRLFTGIEPDTNRMLRSFNDA